MATARVRGLKEARKALRALPEAMQERALMGALAAGGRVIAKEAKQRAPVDRGETQASIVVRRARRRKRVGQGHVVIGFRKGRSRIIHLLEFGTSKMAAQPFVRPAIDAAKTAAVRAFGKSLAAGIRRAAKTVAGPMTRRQRGRIFR